MHTHYEILFLKKGNADFVMENNKFQLHEYDLLLIPPSKFHFISLAENEDYDRHVINFHETNRIKPLLNACFDSFKIFSLNESDLICDIFNRFDIYAERFKNEHLDLIINSLMTELLLNISKLKDSELSGNYSPLSKITYDAVEYINENFHSIKNIEELAGHLFTSKSYLFHVFKIEMGVTIMNYIRNKRILYAETLLNIGEKPTKIFTKCGFNDYVSFYRSYKQYMHHSPKKRDHSRD
ncbi:AraC family transcriptional regulator [Clostridia bacterium]|nr:AraC family transcriptional regulator [Clostridia bacterium]